MITGYIIYSPSVDAFYIGVTQEGIEHRLLKHNQSDYVNHFTSKAHDWQLFLLLPCDSVAQSMKIEKHIKSMKSRKYIQNLKTYPEIFEKLKIKYV